VDAKNYDAIVAVIGETPSAEMMGDIAPSSTLRFGDRFPDDVALLEKVAQSGKPVVVVFVAERPLFVNHVLNLSDAFVMAWLPGSEGGGVADVLFAAGQGKRRDNFTGTLPRPWPGVPCPDASKASAARWLFAPGYGLRYPTRHDLPALSEYDDVKACADASSLSVFHTLAAAPFALYLADSAQGERAVGSDLNGEIAWPDDHPLLRLRTVQINTQQDAKAVTWLGAGRFLARSPQPVDLTRFAAAHAALRFDVVVDATAKGPVTLSMGCGSHCGGSVDLGTVLAGHKAGTRQSVSVPLACFARRGVNLAHVDVPFEIAADAPFAASFADIRISAVASADRHDLSCASVGVR
jgi:beta-glucosidase